MIASQSPTPWARTVSAMAVYTPVTQAAVKHKVGIDAEVTFAYRIRHVPHAVLASSATKRQKPSTRFRSQRAG
jgi:hypothetical protein